MRDLPCREEGLGWNYRVSWSEVSNIALAYVVVLSVTVRLIRPVRSQIHALVSGLEARVHRGLNRLLLFVKIAAIGFQHRAGRFRSWDARQLWQPSSWLECGLYSHRCR